MREKKRVTGYTLLPFYPFGHRRTQVPFRAQAGPGRLAVTKSAFTMVEILVTVTIMVIAIAAISLSFQGGVASWTKGSARMERYLNARVALDMMSREIKASFIYYNNEFFRGWSDSLNFVATIEPVGAATDLYTIRYSFDTTDKELDREYTPVVDSDITTISGTSEPLASNITALTFQYYNATVWQPTWDSRTVGTEAGTLPSKVNISITVRDELSQESGQTFQTIVYLPNSG